MVAVRLVLAVYLCPTVNGALQKQIVTCSGGRNTGSINVIRNGADFQELAFIQGLTDIARVWSVRDMFEDK